MTVTDGLRKARVKRKKEKKKKVCRGDCRELFSVSFQKNVGFVTECYQLSMEFVICLWCTVLCVTDIKDSVQFALRWA